MIKPIATFESGYNSVYISFVKENYFCRMDVYRKSYNEACYDETFRSSNTAQLKRATFLLGKYTDKPMGDIKKFLNSVILGLAQNNYDDNNKCKIIALVKDDDKLYTKPYNDKPHLGRLYVEPTSLELRKLSRNSSSGKVPKEIDVGIRVTYLDPNFDKDGNSLEKEFECSVELRNKNDGDSYEWYTTKKVRMDVLGDRTHFFYAGLYNALMANRPTWTDVELFTTTFKSMFDDDIDKNILKNMLLKWDGFKDRKEEIERFFQPEPETEEINLNHSL